MKIFLLTFLLLYLAVSAFAQLPPVGIIDFYGLRTVSVEQVRAALQIKEGDLLTNSPVEAEKRLMALPNVVQAKLNAVCCDDLNGKTILYVGISEKGSNNLKFRAASNGAIRLPDEMVKAGAELDAALQKAVVKGDVGEDDSQGHALFNNADARKIQLRYLTFAAQNLKLLRKVLRESSDAQHRALAAEIIAYAPDKREIIADLVHATSDANSAVRNNSIRALGIIAQFAQRFPEKKIKVPFEPFIALLNSIEWTDRNKASLALLQLTANRNADLLAKLQTNALSALIEMARWKNPGHANAPFFILGRIAGLTDEEIYKIWQSGNREALIERLNN